MAAAVEPGGGARRWWRRLARRGGGGGVPAGGGGRAKFLGRRGIGRLSARPDLFGGRFGRPGRALNPSRRGVLMRVTPALPTGLPRALRRRRGHLRDSASSGRDTSRLSSLPQMSPGYVAHGLDDL